MIVISSSLPKSASTLLANYTEELLRVSGRKYGQDYLYKKLGGRYFDRLTPSVIMKTLLISLLKGDIVIKTHSTPHLIVRWLIYFGLAKATYIYRDPRDVVLSAKDHCERSNGKHFPQFITIRNGIDFLSNWLKIFLLWKSFGKVLFLRYEKLVIDPFEELSKLQKWLNIELTDSDLKEIIEKQQKKKIPVFNKGTTFRYRTEMLSQDIEYFNKKYNHYLSLLGY